MARLRATIARWGEPGRLSLALARRLWLAASAPARANGAFAAQITVPPLDNAALEACQVLSQRDDILRRIEPGGCCIEVGVDRGDFSRRILDLAAPRHLTLVDLDLTGPAVAGRFASEIEAGTVSLHEGDSADFLATLPDASLDFAYIDGDHSYAGVRRDIAAIASKMRPGGILAFDDYVVWSPGESIAYGVVRAVNEFVIESGWPLRFISLGNGGYPSVGLQRPAQAADPSAPE